MIPQILMRAVALALCHTFGGFGVASLVASFVNGRAGAYAVLCLATATALSWALGRS